MRLRLLLLVPILAIGPALAQLTYKDCGALNAADFRMTELFNKKGTAGAAMDTGLSEPTRMDVQVVNKPDGSYSYSNIYFVERLGKVKFYDGLAKKVTQIGNINVFAKTDHNSRGNDNGLMGMALDPHFESNHWIYFWYAPVDLIGQNRQLRLTRIPLKGDNTLDMAREKILINILASKEDHWHSGGPMTFDVYGDLWVAVGNNGADLTSTLPNVMSKTDSTQSAEWGSSNTHNLRGGFFRIHPDSSEKGYSIPQGNFGEYWAAQFEKQGRLDLAKQYRDTSKVLPEVYVKGERSNFSVAVHPTKRWLAWGTVNPTSVSDEFNVTDHPIFSGYPYFYANNIKTGTHNVDPSAPKNLSPFNSGVTELPPAIPGTINSLVNIAISGPIYRFDAGLKSDAKFPPHFDNHWLVAGFSGGMWVITLDTATLKPVDVTKVDDGLFNSFRIRNHVMSMFGKDGALYILNYSGGYNNASNPAAMRVAYSGSCHVPYVSVAPAVERDVTVRFDPQGMSVAGTGFHRFELYALSGGAVFRAHGRQAAEYRFADLAGRYGLRPGIYVARVRTSQGLTVRNISIL